MSLMFEIVGRADMMVWVGNNYPPTIIEFLGVDIPDDQESAPGDYIDLTGSDLYLTIGRGTPYLIEKNTLADADVLVVDESVAQLQWTPTIAETRTLPLGRLAKYEVERRIDGNQQTIAAGFVIVEGGLNSD